MPCRRRPEAEEQPQRCNTAQHLRTIERWLQHAEEALLYAPDAQGEAAVTPLDARYSLCWGGGGMGILAIVRFPMDARHPVTQKPYGAYAVGEVFPFMDQDQLYYGRVIERLVSRADGLVELHAQAVCGEGATLSCRPSAVADAGNGLCRAEAEQAARNPAPTQSRQEGAP